jgi:DNA-binding response OmpR family regulator
LSTWKEHITSGRDALGRLRRGRVSLLVLDLERPDMDGAVLAHQVHRDGLTPAMLLLTPRLGSLPVTRQLEGTVVSCMAKPFAVREFLARTRSLL